MLTEQAKFPRYLVQTLRRLNSSVYIPGVDLSNYEQQFAHVVASTPAHHVTKLEQAFVDLSFYLRAEITPNEQAYYLRHLSVLAARICELKEIDVLVSHQTDLTFDKTGRQLPDSPVRGMGSTLRL